MTAIERSASGVWRGRLKDGSGAMTTPSGVLQETDFSFATRFGDERGTNPEELIAAAHAGCYSMAFANFLDEKGYEVEEIRTRATITLEDLKLTAMQLVTEGRVKGIDENEFRQLASEADKNCPVSNLLRDGLEISVEATLKQ